jgi:hypothetical protein
MKQFIQSSLSFNVLLRQACLCGLGDDPGIFNSMPLRSHHAAVAPAATR